MSRDIQMQFGFEKCAVLKMKRGNPVYCKGIDLGDGVVIEERDEEGSKYLGILERDNTCQEKMKEKVLKEYYKRVKAVLQYKLNGGNAINASNIWAVATVRFWAIIMNWNKGQLDKMTDNTKTPEFFDYTENNNERLLKAATEELQLGTKIDGKNKEEQENEGQAVLKKKALYGRFLRETEGMQGQRSSSG